MRGKPVKQKEIDIIKTLRLKEMSIYEIAERIDRAPSFVYYRIADLGLNSQIVRELAKKVSKSREGISLSEEHRRKIGRASKRLWKNQEFRRKTIRNRQKALQTRPNKAEAKLRVILNHLFPDEYCYVGDGEAIIGGYCPDFVNVNGKKKIIELFGVIFHDPDQTFKDHIPYEQTEDGRVELFAEYGYDTLIVWDYELNDDEALEEKLVRFHNSNTEGMT